MEKHSITLGSAEISFAKLSATPSPTSWSHVYSAGTLFAVISLKYKEIPENVLSLSMVGKDMISALEEEYFTLETKSFEGVKDAVLKSINTVPPSVYTSIALAAIPPGKEKLLYIYTQGNGSVIFKRGGKVGHLLGQQEEFQSASGLLENKDTVVLATDQVTKTIPSATIISSLDLSPTDFADFFTPKLQEGDGSEAAFILSYNALAPTPPPEEKPEEEKKDPEKDPEGHYSVHSYQDNEELSVLEENKSFSVLPKISLQTITEGIKKGISLIPLPQTHLTHKRKMVLTVAVIGIIALLASIGFIVKKQQDAKNQAAVQQILEKADKKYQEGLVLIGLNKNLARDDLEEAQEILQEGKGTFSEGSTERKQIDDLLTKVSAALEESSDTAKVTPKEIAVITNPRLSLFAQKKALYSVFSESTIYYISSSGISSVSSSGTNDKQIIKKAWNTPKGLGVFGSNIYVLDSADNQIFKFVPSGSTYTKSNYLTDDVDLSSAVDLSIDSSIYVLFKNGSVNKFTKGKKDTFTITGLEKPLSNPTRVFTHPDTQSLYILDPGNSRIVLLNKNGTYLSQIQANVIKSAAEFDVNTKDKKMYVLSGNKLYELPLP